MDRIRALILYPGAFCRSLRNLTERERLYLAGEIAQARGLMPLLMKPRNSQRWTPEERRVLAVHLRRLTAISPYLFVLACPAAC